MSSFEGPSLLATSPTRATYRRNTFLLLQDDQPTLNRGQGALAHLIRNRSHISLGGYGSTWRGQGIDTSDIEASGEAQYRTYCRTPDSEILDDPELARRAQDERRLSARLSTDAVRSLRLIGNSNPRYRWARYWVTQAELAKMRKPIREYYERTNYLIQQYLYIDRLLDSSLPHDLVNEYNSLPAHHFRGVEVPDTILEEPANLDGRKGRGSLASERQVGSSSDESENSGSNEASGPRKVTRTPKAIYQATESTPLFDNADDMWDEGNDGPKPDIPWLEHDDDVDNGDRIVTVAIYINFAANAILLAGKIAVIISVSSMSVLASLVDAVLDFLSTVIVWVTTVLISRHDQYNYPVGRRRLEPLGILVFSIIMVTSFVQVGLESTQRLLSPEHELIKLGTPAIATMAGTIFIKGLCWLWCRMVKNSSVQALATDAMTDVVFNTGSILFPIAGWYLNIWWLDALGGLLLSLIVIRNWSGTSMEHIKNLCGFSATADQRNVLLYLTMRFAKTIRQIQGLQAYHAGDKLNVEVDIVLDASTTLRDVHDVSESLGYVLESVPIVDRAFVHSDYASWNLPTHMNQQQRNS